DLGRVRAGLVAAAVHQVGRDQRAEEHALRAQERPEQHLAAAEAGAGPVFLVLGRVSHRGDRHLVSRPRSRLTTKAAGPTLRVGTPPGGQGATTKSYHGDTSRRSNAASRDAAAADCQATPGTG